MTEPTVPAGDAGADAPIDPQFEQAFTAALHDHARTVTAPGDPAALTARLVRTDKVVGLRRIGLATGAVVVVVLGLLVFGANRRDTEVRTAGSTQATAVSPSPTTARGPGGTDPASTNSDSTVDASTGTTSDVSIPLPGEVGPDGSTSTTAATTPGGATTSSPPGATPTTRPGSPVTTGPGGPTPTSPTGPTTPNPTTGPTAPPTTSGPTTTPSSSTPPTTADPRQPPQGPQSSWCAAHQVSPTMSATSGAAGTVLVSELELGFAPPLTEITVAGDTAGTDRLILSTSVRSDTTGKWSWKIRWNASGTPLNTDLHYTIKCVANGKTVPFTVRRV